MDEKGKLNEINYFYEFCAFQLFGENFCYLYSKMVNHKWLEEDVNKYYG